MTNNEILTCRRILSIMVITCFCLAQILRVNISIAIVDMTTNTTNEHFQWTEKQKGDILGSILWGQIVMSIPSGRLSEMYGPKILIGTTMLSASVLTFLTPFFASFNYYMLLLSRVGIGVVMGAASTCVPPIGVRWVAPTDMSKFLSHTRANHLGAALILPICGLVIANWGWRCVFYLTGGLSMIWSLCWFYLMYDSPSTHPRISAEEKELIINEVIYDSRSFRRRDIPWRKILLSVPVWANIVSSACCFFSVNLAVNNLPSYMNQVLRYDIKQNGLLCGLPYLALYFSAFCSSCLADHWRKSKKFTRSTIRKFFLVLTFAGPAIMFTIAAFYGDQPIICVLVFIFWLSFSGCAVPSLNANVVDIAPMYVGSIAGIVFTFCGLAGYTQTKVVAFIIQENQTLEQWKYVFWVVISVNLFGLVISLLFGSTKIQSWNFNNQNVEIRENEKGDQLPLREKN